MKYVALLRGIGPGNPNMRSEKLTAFFEDVGFANVRTVITSGNVVFDSPSKSAAALEAKIEKAMPLKLGFARATIVRSKKELEALLQKDPYKKIEDKLPNYLLVTFFKDRRPELCSVLNINATDVTESMRILDRDHKKAMTSRTWKTVGRILKKMNET